MKIGNAQRAEVLTQALPYIQEYNNKIIAVKYGGNAMINEELKQQVMGDIVLLSLIGVKVVLIHGGGRKLPSCSISSAKKRSLSTACASRTGGRSTACRWCWGQDQ
jgi:hypothetical protein